MINNSMEINLTDTLFISVKEAAEILHSTPNTLYSYLCNSGSKSGKQRQKFPPDIYRKIGRKVLFIKPKLIEWVLNGAQMSK